MPALRQYNNTTSQWDLIIAGSAGPQGTQGPQGAQGATGPQGPAGLSADDANSVLAAGIFN